jgi:D-alanyl-D-alanine carboxypeptidase/D-alanyl-D-alanine-endopeptidase (penicillin-binding protein 4)
MQLTRFWLPTLAILATTSLTGVSPSLGNDLQPIPQNPVYFQEEGPIEIYVPPPENNRSGSCAALIQPAIDNIINPYQKHWGVLVEKLEDGTLLYSNNADKHFIPASNNKIFTTAAALQLLSPSSKIGSKSLQSWVNVTNVRSNNYYADTLLRHIGGQQASPKML